MDGREVVMGDERLVLTREQVRRVDTLAVEELRFPSIVLMENAGKNSADWIRSHCEDTGGDAVVFAGTGNNGGDGFVIARHLHNHGWSVRVCLLGEAERLSPDAATNHAIVSAMGVAIEILGDAEEIERACARLSGNDLVIDAMLGTGFSGSVREPMAAAVRGLNAATTRGIIAVDVPSGLDCDTGEVGNVAILADATITFVAAKRGFETPGGRRHVGEVVVVDIGTPPSLIERVRRG